MSECTKGKLRVERIGSKLFIVDDKGFSVTKVRYSKKAEANAKELVCRWNAFEDGGIVEELRKACEKLIKANEYARNISLRDEAPRGIIWGDTRSRLDVAKLKAKAALAKS